MSRIAFRGAPTYTLPTRYRPPTYRIGRRGRCSHRNVCLFLRAVALQPGGQTYVNCVYAGTIRSAAAEICSSIRALVARTQVGRRSPTTRSSHSQHASPSNAHIAHQHAPHPRLRQHLAVDPKCPRQRHSGSSSAAAVSQVWQRRLHCELPAARSPFWSNQGWLLRLEPRYLCNRMRLGFCNTSGELIVRKKREG